MPINNAWCLHSGHLGTRDTRLGEWPLPWGQLLFCLLLRICCPQPHSRVFLASASASFPPPSSLPSWVDLWGPSPWRGHLMLRRMSSSFLPQQLADVSPGFVLKACNKNSSYPPTVQIIIFQWQATVIIFVTVYPDKRSSAGYSGAWGIPWPGASNCAILVTSQDIVSPACLGGDPEGENLKATWYGHYPLIFSPSLALHLPVYFFPLKMGFSRCFCRD